MKNLYRILLAAAFIHLSAMLTFAQATFTVTISGSAFLPQNQTGVVVGDNVVWRNLDGFNHTSSSNNSTWNSGSLSQNATYTFTPTQAGTYNYACAIHSFMTGSIVVAAATGLPADNSVTREIMLYPNPVQNNMRFSEKLVSLAIASSVNLVEIYDAKGVFIKSETIRSLADGLDVSTLKSGVYMLKIPQINKTISFAKQ